HHVIGTEHAPGEAEDDAGGDEPEAPEEPGDVAGIAPAPSRLQRRRQEPHGGQREQPADLAGELPAGQPEPPRRPRAPRGAPPRRAGGCPRGPPPPPPAAAPRAPPDGLPRGPPRRNRPAAVRAPTRSPTACRPRAVPRRCSRRSGRARCCSSCPRRTGDS